MADFLDDFEETPGIIAQVAGAQLEFHHTVRGLVVRVRVQAPNRLRINSAPIEGRAQALIIGPAAAAFWETVQPSGRPARSVEGVSFTYDASDQTLTLLARSQWGNQVLLNSRDLARLELCVIGPAAGQLWQHLQQKRGEELDPFADFQPTPADL